MVIKRIKKEVSIGDIQIGGLNPIAIQSMTNTYTEDIKSTVFQINELSAAGCEIIRVAVPSIEAAYAITEIKSQISIPIVADIHFDYRLALAAIKAGADKIRINPGNIGSESKVKELAVAAKAAGIPIRIGANSGSVNRSLLKANGMSKALYQSAAEQVSILETAGFEDIIIAIKSTDVFDTIEACKKIDQDFPYPQHIGITESGTLYDGIIKSAAGIGALLCLGIGSTLRVSLTADPIEEIKCAKTILKQLGLRNYGPRMVSCPTCGRTKVNLVEMAERVKKDIEKLKSNIKIAVMGCSVNGPGEAVDADIGIAGGKDKYILFKKGKVIGSFAPQEAYEKLIEEIKEFENE